MKPTPSSRTSSSPNPSPSPSPFSAADIGPDPLQPLMAWQTAFHQPLLLAWLYPLGIFTVVQRFMSATQDAVLSEWSRQVEGGVPMDG